jgi:glycosyltransferase involved in cell wall biosynthesis
MERTTHADISVVLPLFNEEENLLVLYEALVPALSSITENYEIIFADDGSRDNSFGIVKEISRKNNRVLGISLSRNFGHQVALSAGIEHATGKVVVTMDADMQHPPILIRELYKKHLEGYDIVNTIRLETDDSSWFKNITSKGFYFLINKFSDVRIEPGAADFRLMNRKSVNAFLRLKERDRFTRGLISWMGFRQAAIPYKAPPRYAGRSKYSVRKMFRFATDGITSFSSKPLRLSFYMGVIAAFFGLCYAVYAIVEKVRGETMQGWASILLSVLILGGIQLISIGIIGEYLARVFNEAKGRPLYLVKEYTYEEDANER